MRSKKIEWLIFTLFVLLTFFLRFPSFFQSAIGVDESLYLLVAKNLIDGHPPYTVVWDNKPPGIYFLFSLALRLFGNSFVSIRILACIAVSITSYLLYRLGKVISHNDTRVGLLAGILYAITSLGSGGIGANTEIFYAPFAVFAFYLLFSDVFNPVKRISQSYLRLFIIGLAMGIGCQIKQVVIFEFIGILLIVGLHLYFQHSNSWKSLFAKLFKCYALLFPGIFIPFLPILLYFIINGHLSDYVYANFTANLARVSGASYSISGFVAGFLIQLKSNLLLWICLLLIPVYWISSGENNPESKRTLIYLVVWFSMAFLGVCSPKTFYYYYFLQLLPSLCLLSSYIITKSVATVREIGKARILSILALILLPHFFNIVDPYFKLGIKSIYSRHIKRIDSWGDEPAIISKYLRERVSPKDYIYVADYDYGTIIYYLVPAQIPTKYVFPFFLTTNLSSVPGIDPIQELHSIMKKKPAYIIRVKPNGVISEKFFNELESYLKLYYVWDKDFQVHRDIFGITMSDSEVYNVEAYRLKNKTVK